MKKEIIINKSDNEYCFQIKILDISHLKQVMSLADSVQEEMVSKGFLKHMLHRNEDYYSTMLSHKEDAVCGVFITTHGTDHLIAISCHHYCMSRAELDRKFPEANCHFKDNSIGIFSSVCVAQEYRGLGLLGQMNDFVHGLADYDFSVTTVKIDNTSSLKGFLKKKYIIIKSVLSPVDGAEICLLVKDHRHEPELEEIAIIDIADIQSALSEEHYVSYCNHKDKLRSVNLINKWF